MTALAPERFDEFFVALQQAIESGSGSRPHTAARLPFAWQRRLAQQVVASGHWPEVIDAPTGSGKSSVIDIHVFANAVAASRGAAVRPPQRLSMTVARRALTDDNAARANQIADALAGATEGILAEVESALLSMRETGSDFQRGLHVTRLRGGAPPARDWLDDPAGCQVIASTPEMWGSRLLFGGYGSRGQAHPREAGLLAFDNVVVVDEAHLNRQLVVTARRVRDLVAPDRELLGVEPLQVTAMSATTPASQGVAGVEEDDLDANEVLARRLLRPKPVRLVESAAGAGFISAGRTRTAEELVSAAVELRQATGGTVACLVNTVKLAELVIARLRNHVVPEGSGQPHEGQHPVVEPIVGRMRPYDIGRLRTRRPGLFRHGGDPDVDFVVATQTIEVGVDMDFAGMVTQLASGSAIAQRAGRVNRSGSRDTGPVVVLVPQDESVLDKERDVAPYTPSDLRAALAWLRQRAATPDGLAPWALHPRGGGATPPEQSPRRPVWHRVEWWNARDWARTSEDLFADHDLGLWLEDDLDADLTGGLVVRHLLPTSAASARALVEAMPPVGQEVFPAPIALLRQLASRVAGRFDDGSRKIIVLRAGEVVRPADLDLDADAEVRLRPSDVVVVDDSEELFEGPIPSTEGTSSASDVSEDPTRDWRTPRRIRVSHGAACARHDDSADRTLDDLRAIVAAAGPTSLDAEVHSLLRARLQDWASGPETGDGAPRPNARDILVQLVADASSTLTVSPAGSDQRTPSREDFWIVITGPGAVSADEELRQTWTPGRKPVLLSKHQEAVADSARELGLRLDLAWPLPDALHRAGLLHDEGKKDRRFQRQLRVRDATDSEPILAKSGMRDPQVIFRARQASGLPAGWRHEQLSAVHAWTELAAEDPGLRDLVTRLVGTSHGYGRGAFVHVARQLLRSSEELEAAQHLFDDGQWDCLIDRTHARWGFWGAAYLEALLRAADGNVSRRGQ